MSSTILVIPYSSTVNAANPSLFPLNVNKALSIKWWQWVVSIPSDNNPLRNSNCNVKQSGPIFYLVGSEGGSVERSCTIPKEKGIFFPILSVLATLDKNDPELNTIDKIKKAATDVANLFKHLKIMIDGTQIKNIKSLRAQSPVFQYTVPSDNILDQSAGKYTAVSDGYWVPLKPLSVGQYDIHFQGSVPEFDFKIDVTYHLTIK